MKTSEPMIGFIKSFEGLEKVLKDGRIQSYKCPAGIWTIGWGTTGKDVTEGTIWSIELCDMRFRNHIAQFERTVLRHCKTVTQNQFDALVSFVYNVGEENFRKSTLLRLHNEGRFVEAAKQFQRWNKGGGKVLKGLTRRRLAEAEVYGRDFREVGKGK